MSKAESSYRKNKSFACVMEAFFGCHLFLYRRRLEECCAATRFTRHVISAIVFS